MPIIAVRLNTQELADLDRLRGTVGRSTWLKSLMHDAVRARDAFGRACGLRVVADERMPQGAVAVVQGRAAADPEGGPLVPEPARDQQVARITGHPVQPCRCENCEQARGRVS